MEIGNWKALHRLFEAGKRQRTKNIFFFSFSRLPSPVSLAPFLLPKHICLGGGSLSLSHLHEENGVGRKHGDDVHHGLKRNQVRQLIHGEVQVQEKVSEEKT